MSASASALQIDLIMHIPRQQQRIHWSNTIPDGSCALVALAQALHLLTEKSFRAVQEVSADDRMWMRNTLKPLREHLATNAEWIADMIPAWTYHGLSEDDDDTNCVNREAITASQWIRSDSVIKMAKELKLNVNFWEGQSTEIIDLDDEHKNHVTKYALVAALRDGEECICLDATVSKILDLFDGNSVDIMQTQHHYFIHPDSFSMHERLKQTLIAANDRWMP